jgi:two-component system sensor histidine kinase MtrB
MTAALQAQILRLENLSRLQQRFVSDVSHELRTPLTTIRMASQVLHAERNNFEPALARSAELLMNQIDRFEALLSDLLEVSRFDAEAAVMETQEVDLTQLVRESIEYVHPSQDRSVELIVPTDPVLVAVDPRRIQRIIRNLVTNALDHREDKPVEVRIAGNENEVAFSVRDHGLGLTEEETKRVFDRFWRKDPARTRTRGSSGLGLSIAKEDAILHHGELEVWARPSQGAHFVLTIPRHPGGVIQNHPISVIPE